MINPTKQAARVEFDGLPGERREFTIKATGKAFRTLIDGLYENKVAAPVREIISNAYDAHAAAGTPEIPIQVTAPTTVDPTFRVRDFGVSMGHEMVMDLYSQLFNSTKENTNNEIGMFGLGSKSPFAYTDTFSVTTFRGGEKRVYVAHISDDDVPQITHITTEPQLDEPQGVEVAIPVKPGDVSRFHREINRMIMASDVRPEVDGIAENNQPPIPVLAGQDVVTGYGWRVLKDTYSFGEVAVRQGCVIYPVHGYRVPELSYGYTLIVDVPIGSVEVTASRESLSMTGETAKVVERHLSLARAGIREWVASIKFQNRLEEYRKRNQYSFLANPIGRDHIDLRPDKPNKNLTAQSLEVFMSKRKTKQLSTFKKPQFKLIVTHPGERIVRGKLRMAEFYESHRYSHTVAVVPVQDLPRAVRLLGIGSDDVISASELPDVQVQRAKPNKGVGVGYKVPKATKGKFVVVKSSTKKLKDFTVGPVTVESMDDMFNPFDHTVRSGWNYTARYGIGPLLKELGIEPDDVVFLTEKQAEKQNVQESQLLLSEITKRARKWAKKEDLQTTLDRSLDRHVYDKWSSGHQLTNFIAQTFGFSAYSYHRTDEQDILVQIGHEMAELALEDMAPGSRQLTEIEKVVVAVLGLTPDVSKVTLTESVIDAKVKESVQDLAELAKVKSPLRFLVRQYLNNTNNTEDSNS